MRQSTFRIANDRSVVKEWLQPWLTSVQKQEDMARLFLIAGLCSRSLLVVPGWIVAIRLVGSRQFHPSHWKDGRLHDVCRFARSLLVLAMLLRDGFSKITTNVICNIFSCMEDGSSIYSLALLKIASCRRRVCVALIVDDRKK